MSDKSFFNKPTEQSQVKAMIVSKYFYAWATVISRQDNVDRIAYLDLFSGPGRYKDGTISTPVMVLTKAIADTVLCQKMIFQFRDKNELNIKDLEAVINALPGIGLLKYPPEVKHDEVGTEMIKKFKTMKLIPTLLFVDPWGYKGLSLDLVNSVLKDWACECIFFFNYNRVNPGLSNPTVLMYMNNLFGEENANNLRNRLEKYNKPNDRELAIVESLCKALNPGGNRFVAPFTFKSDTGKRTMHHLIFVSKHPRGYSIMKEIMAKESSAAPQDVATFVYSPADNRFPVLFEYSQPLEELKSMLIKEYPGETMTVQQLFDRHNIGRPFTLKNYKSALIELHDVDKVITDRTEQHKKLHQCPDSIIIQFPRG